MRVHSDALKRPSAKNDEEKTVFCLFLYRVCYALIFLFRSSFFLFIYCCSVYNREFCKSLSENAFSKTLVNAFYSTPHQRLFGMFMSADCITK